MANIPTHFSTIVIDPPWTFTGPGWLGGTKRHYDSVSLVDIARLPIPQLAEPSAHLWMWATDTHLENALSLITTWGFTRRATFVWIKLTKGQITEKKAETDLAITYMGTPRSLTTGNGYYGRGNPEYLLLATRGDNIVQEEGRHVRRVFAGDVEDALIFSERGEHSTKPEEAYRIIEKFSPPSRLDIFGRAPHEGFYSWGDEAEDCVDIPKLLEWAKGLRAA
jgi:N6-adenosine-specific RNA methylase IME4